MHNFKRIYCIIFGCRNVFLPGKYIELRLAALFHLSVCVCVCALFSWLQQAELYIYLPLKMDSTK